MGSGKGKIKREGEEGRERRRGIDRGIGTGKGEYSTNLCQRRLDGPTL